MSSDLEVRESIAVEPSVSSALEHLVVASQGVITKRIDLALLEGQELVSRTVRDAILAGLGGVLAVVAWIALAAALVEWVAGGQLLYLRLALFGVINGGAAGLAILLMRPIRESPPIQATNHGDQKPQRRASVEGRPAHGDH